MTALLVVLVAVPGAQGDVTVRLHASHRGPAVLWEDRVKAHPAGIAPWVRIVLGEDKALPPGLGAVPIRYVSVRTAEGAPWGPRAPVDTTSLRLPLRLMRLEARLSELEAAAAPASALATARDALDEHEVRIGRLERSKRVGRLSALARTLAERLDRLDRGDGRVERLEDELEDLVGPDGDVVDLEDRLSELEQAVSHRLRDRADNPSGSQDPSTHGRTA